MSFNTVFQTCRPPFLVLTPVCVLLGLSLAMAGGNPIDGMMFFTIVIGALSAHISVNMLNEYYDFKSGLDLKTQRTAFSGGSGALPNSPELADLVFKLGIAMLLITILIGSYFIATLGLMLLPIGFLGVLIVFTYTKTLNRLPILCLISPGLGFGVLMVVGTYTVLAHELNQTVWLVSLVPFFLINNLLLLNQYPDVEADKSVGRNTFPIAFGVNMSNVVYAVSIIAAFSLLLVLIVVGSLPLLSCIAFIPLLFSVYSLVGAVKYKLLIGGDAKYLATNVISAIFTPLLLAISIFI